MSEEEKEERSVVIEMAAAMINAGVEYALRHQGEMIEAFDKLGKKRKKKALPAKVGT